MFKKIVFTVFGAIFMLIILLNPTICQKSAVSGLFLCYRVIIPSLFPFTVLSLFLAKCSVPVFLISLISGYPVGCKLINNEYRQNKISRRTAHIKQCFCVNAGPAFIVLAVGNGILASKQIGYILFFAHIIASFFLWAIFSRFIKEKEEKSKWTNERFSDIFVKITADAAESVLSICAFVVIFSVIVGYLNYFSTDFEILKVFSYLFEITTAVNSTKNPYLISFLLGFSCFGVIIQIISVSRDAGINFPLFLLSRILHGLLSALFTAIMFKIFKISTAVFSNGKAFSASPFYRNVFVGISLILTAAFFIAELYCKKRVEN